MSFQSAHTFRQVVGSHHTEELHATRAQAGNKGTGQWVLHTQVLFCIWAGTGEMEAEGATLTQPWPVLPHATQGLAMPEPPVSGGARNPGSFFLHDIWWIRIQPQKTFLKNILQAKPSTSTIRFHLKGLQCATSVIKQASMNQLLTHISASD